jgi:hypothetical protein
MISSRTSSPGSTPGRGTTPVNRPLLAPAVTFAARHCRMRAHTPLAHILECLWGGPTCFERQFLAALFLAEQIPAPAKGRSLRSQKIRLAF